MWSTKPLPANRAIGAVPASLVIGPLQHHPDYVATVAAWHHTECVRQGLSSSLQVRTERLLQHLGPAPIPQTLVGLLEGQLVGCVSLVRYQYRPAGASAHAPAPVWLSNLYVEASWREQGVGSALVDAAVAYTQGLKITELWLSSVDQTPFYAKRGWEPKRQTRLAGKLVQVMSLSSGATFPVKR